MGQNAKITIRFLSISTWVMVNSFWSPSWGFLRSLAASQMASFHHFFGATLSYETIRLQWSNNSFLRHILSKVRFPSVISDAIPLKSDSVQANRDKICSSDNEGEPDYRPGLFTPSRIGVFVQICRPISDRFTIGSTFFEFFIWFFTFGSLSKRCCGAWARFFFMFLFEIQTKPSEILTFRFKRNFPNTLLTVENLRKTCIPLCLGALCTLWYNSKMSVVEDKKKRIKLDMLTIWEAV